MATQSQVPEASVYRLSLYHCYLGELVRGDEPVKITSRMLADELGVKEETVRRDLSFVGGVGRPGAGYDGRVLFDAIQEFLGLKDEYPVIRIGSAQMLEALEVVFPPRSYGVVPVAYFSELPSDVGKVVSGLEVRHVTEIADLDPALDAKVALVACSPGWVQITIDLLHKAGIEGLLLLTPKLQLKKPEGMNIVHVRMPCDIKSLACRCALPNGLRTEGAGVLPPIDGIASR